MSPTHFRHTFRSGVYGLHMTSDLLMPPLPSPVMYAVMRMTRTTVDIDDASLDAARRVLGTRGLSETVNAALSDVVRRRTLASFDVLRDIDGTPDEVAAGRRDRAPGDGPAS